MQMQIGKNIALQRAKKGITQSQLAEAVGVSKSAVSKWELGQSYPDITLLPVLAAYFDTSVDELLGYGPELSEEEIDELCLRLMQCFDEKPYPEARTTFWNFLCRYPASWPLLFSVGQLLINYGARWEEKERKTAIYQRALDMFTKISQESRDGGLQQRARQMQAVCYLLLGNTEEAAQLLREETHLSNLSETLLVETELERGDLVRAQDILRVAFLLNISRILLVSAQLMELMGDTHELEIFLNGLMSLVEALQLDSLVLRPLLTVVLAGAKHFCTQGREEEALKLLERLFNLIKKGSSQSEPKKGRQQKLNDYSRSLLGLFTGDHAVIHHTVATRLFGDSALDGLRSKQVFRELYAWHLSSYPKPV